MPRRGPRKPQRFSRYQSIHETVMRRFRGEGFVLADTLAFVPKPDGIYLYGHVAMSGELVLGVKKLLRTIEDDPADPSVMAVLYEYNLSVFRSGSIFRYDNSHDGGEPYPGHPDSFHRHSFDWRTGTQGCNSPAWIGYDKWPTLGEIIEEARDWHADHYAELPHPDSALTEKQLQSLRHFP